MANTIDMKLMRYINLFERTCNVSTTHCFVYNNIIVFAVPKSLVYRAIGKNGENMKRLGEILRKKIKVIETPTDNIENFAADIVDPLKFNKLEVKDGVASITAGRQSKAALIGRNRSREEELEGILRNFFNITKLRIL